MKTEIPQDVRVWIVPLTAASKAQRRKQARRELEQILAQELGEAVQDLGITREQGGKPQLPGRLVNFNLSHSGEIAMIAVSRVRAVGIDVEAARDFKNRDGLARRICSPAELNHLDQLREAGGDQSAELLKLWVRKEAVVKATGEGIVGDLSELEVLGSEVSGAQLSGSWQCVDLPSPAPGYVAALAFARDAC